MSALRKVVSYAWCALAVGVGLGLWYIVVPSEERKKEMVKNLPEANPLRAEETRRRNALMMQVLKEAAETDANLARGIGR
ncbi:ubiquinol-cytochrome-c reductase complex assembly factor 3 [Gadus chalcogrammus]|uniref:ubiquinol-cytochrome-c reductase complex assembly factor 3 n=1 Tax=Gadus chalcogrammus TaxID=1042646 RepID=UPI0024C4D1FD|nr:ubiquinol-cytochrome-c reductase complex assembly factor 3 [Gadus chalcogrammus]